MNNSFLVCSISDGNVNLYKSDMDPRILFTTPADVSALAETIAEYSGVVEFSTPSDAAEAAALLSVRVGRLTTVEFALPSDPLDFPFDAVEAVARVLEADGVRYAYVVDAFVEPSRGVRVQGRIVLNDGAGPETLTVPWEHGEPQFDVATLLAAGMDPARAAETVHGWRHT
jgi:hypothetical protein